MDNISEKKKAIFESTLALVKEHGFHGTPMSLVAKNAGVAAGTIYHYFDSKDTLIIELHAYIRNNMATALLQEDDEQMLPKARFFNFWIKQCQFYIGNPSALYFIEQFVNSPYYNRCPDKDNNQWQNLISEFLRAGINKNILKPIDFKIVAPLVHGSTITTAKVHLSGRTQIGEEQLKQVAQIVWDGIENK